MKKFLPMFLIFFSCLSLEQLTAIIYVNEKAIDMHADTDEMSEIVSQSIYGTPIKILEQRNDWSKIETPDTYSGWCKTTGLLSKDKSYPGTTVVGRVNTIWTHIYYVEDTTPHPPHITLPYGTKVEVLSSAEELQNRWMKVRLLDGGIYAAQCADFVFNPEPLTIDAMVEESKKFVGLPYRWGGNSSFGFDCSGFTQTLFSLMNISLPRDAKLQVNVEGAAVVEYDNLKKGDLVFLSRFKDRVTHVGLYLGDHQFIHAVTTNLKGPHVIQISSLEDQEWKNKYITARRIVPD